MEILTVTKDNFDKEILGADKTVLLDFWATWCGPCQMIAPTIHEIATENPDILVGKVDVDKEPYLAQMFGIVSIPTLMVIKNSEVVEQIVGLVKKEKILEALGK